MTQGKRAERIEPDLGFIRDVKAYGGDAVKKCFQCATCSVVCPISPEKAPFPRKEMIWASWGLKDRLVSDGDIWLCHQCNDCSVQCPREASPGDVIAAVRKAAFEHYAVPGALGKAVASPTALPLLLAIPVAFVALIMFRGHEYNAAMPEVLQHESWFGHYFPLLAVDTLFIATVTIMGLLMIASLSKFWKDMVASMPGTPKESFVGAAIITIKEIVTHSRFEECDKASPRKTPHLLTFWGMIALFATTACVFLGMYFGGPLLDYELHVPMAIGHPVKLLGIAGAIAFCAGLLLLLNNRLNDPDGTGSTTYQDTLFIWTLLIVGLSGVGSYVLRMASPDPTDAAAAINAASAVPTMAVAVYFVHLVSVWFLLAYLPYSKFAHMVYRTFALIRAHQVDRWKPAPKSASLPKKPEPKPEKKESAEKKDEEKHEEKDEEKDEEEDKEEAAATS